MANLYSLKIITPEKIFFDGMTSQITARTPLGDLGILANHASLVADLPAGPLRIKNDETGKFRTAAISGGILKVGGNKVNILANAIEWADEIDIIRAQKAVEEAKLEMQRQKSRKEFNLAEMKLKRALNRISVHDKYGK